jgi:hypothetical protein
MAPVGKLIISLGILLIVVGLVIIVLNRTIPLGQFPGDVTLEKGDLKFYFPFTTGLVVSSVLTGLALLIAIIL